MMEILKTKMKYQNYNHYKLPITMDPLKYGKLIYKNNNLFITQVNKTNIALITEYDNLNHIKFFKEGDLVFEYRDHKHSENIIIRTISNKKYFFEMLNRLIILIFILLVYITFFLIEDNTLLAVLPLNIVKLRRVASKNK
jgi:hypothetical protein